MFSVYGVSGRQFTGSAEQLRQIERVNAASRVRRLEANETTLPERVSADPLLPGPAPTAVAGAGIGSPAARRNALAAYTQSQPRETQRSPLSRVEDIMTQPALTLTHDTPMREAWRLLAYHGHAQAPVVSASGMLVGLLLHSELLRPDRMATPELDAEAWRVLMAQPIGDLMWTPVPSATPDTDIRRVAGVLTDSGLPGLPVVDDAGMVTGFVSRGDIVRAVAHDPPLDLWS
jgi:CBS domain-containing protein